MALLDQSRRRIISISFAALVVFGAFETSSRAAQLSDNFGAATPITGFIDLLVPNGQATAEPSEPDHAGAPPNRSLWAIWIAPSNATYSISTSNSLRSGGLLLDTVLAVYTGTSLTNLSLVVDNDDEAPFCCLWSKVFFRAYAGEVFHIAIDVLGSDTGNISLHINTSGIRPPPWTAAAVRGGTILSTNYTNQILLVDFWETTCSACVTELPELVRLYETYRSRGFTIIGLATDPDPELVENYLSAHAVPYVMGFSSSSNSSAFGGVPGNPTKYLVDREGRIAARFVDGVDPPSDTVRVYGSAIELISRPPPDVSLRVARDAGNLTISWPATVSGFRLEAASQPAPATWNTVSATVQTNNGRYVLTLPTGDLAQFFRLKRP
jgi:glutathione peroxidase-family protein